MAKSRLALPTALATTAMIAITTSSSFAQSGPEGWRHGPGMMWGGYGGGFGMLFGLVFMIIVLAAVAVGLLLLLRALGFMDNSSGASRGAGNAALDILKERFAKGEIDAKEFDERKRHLAD